MTDNQAEIEIEGDNENEPEVEEKPKRLTITKKKTNELSEAEKKQLIEDARNGIENEYFQVKPTKTGKPRISVRRTTLSQQLLNDANETQPVQIPRKYLTDNQLLLEHVINLETSFNKLHSKHKKLKKRYNELEGYLYNNNDTETDDDEEQQKPISESQKVQEKPIPQEPTQIQQQQEPQQRVQYRYVKSWRQLGQQ